MKKFIAMIMLLCPFLMMAGWKSEAGKLIRDYTSLNYTPSDSSYLGLRDSLKNKLSSPDSKKNSTELLKNINRRIDKQEDMMRKLGSINQRGNSGAEQYLSRLLDVQKWLEQGLKKPKNV